MTTVSKRTLSSKLPQNGSSIFNEMTQLAIEHKAINLSQGFPDFMPSSTLLDLVFLHMKSGHNQYAPLAGLMKLREKVSSLVGNAYGFFPDPENEITITTGGTQAIYTAITSILREGEEVIIFEPAYDSYIPSIILNQGIPRIVELKAPDFRINWDEVKRLISSKTRMIILNSPHNPTGSMLTESDLHQLNTLISGTEILVISDEVYEHIFFDGNVHQSICRFPELFERSFVISSFGKSCHTTGWKIGYCIAPNYLSREFRKVHQFIVFSVNTPIQYALADFLEQPNPFRDLPEFYQKKRDYFALLMRSTRFKLLSVQGTYFQLASYEPISSENEKDFARKLTIDHGVAGIPLSSFYGKHQENKLIRFCFAKTDQTLEEAAERLSNL